MKEYKILRTTRQTVVASEQTPRLQTLTDLAARLQDQFPDDEFCIVDQDGNPPEPSDFAIADLSVKQKKESAKIKEIYLN